MHDSLSRSSRGAADRLRGVSPTDAAAETWARRLRSGLTIQEEVELADWLAADAGHETALRKYQAAWERFEPMARAVADDPIPDPNRLVSLDPSSHRLLTTGKNNNSRDYRSTARRWSMAGLGLAAAIIVMLAILTPRQKFSAGTPIILPALVEQRSLADGSVVELNRGAEISVEFAPGVRRVRLERGEANFAVAKDPDRPFIVAAGEVEVRAVGTAFNVLVDPGSVEVVVMEGRVAVVTRKEGGQNPLGGGLMSENGRGVGGAHRSSSGESLPSASGRSWAEIVAGQRAIVTRSAPEPQVTDLTPVEMEARLAWQPKLLDFDDVPLSQIVAEFNRRNPMRLVVTDPVVADRRMTATFRSDNLEAFVRSLESSIGVQMKRVNESEIALVRK